MSKSKGRKGSKSTDPMEGLPSKPRLCRLDKGNGGYGFNLHGEKGKHGQFIRAVDPGSPADIAGVKPGDRVIEVSGTNIERETHSQVVARIRADGGKTVLLVADRELDNYCKEHNITIKVDMTTEAEADEEDDDDPPHVNGINGSVDAVVEIEQTPEQPKMEEEERIEATEEQREESQPEVIAVPDPEPQPEPEEAQEPEEDTRPHENDVGEDEEVVAASEAAEVHAEPEPEREPTPEPEPEPEREPTPEPPREPTPPPPEPVREPTPPPPEPVREPTPPPPEPEPQIEEVDAPVPLPDPKVSQPPPARPPAPKVDSTGLDLSDMSKARALAAGQRKKKQAAQQDWRSKYNAFNQL